MDALQVYFRSQIIGSGRQDDYQTCIEDHEEQYETSNRTQGKGRASSSEGSIPAEDPEYQGEAGFGENSEDELQSAASPATDPDERSTADHTHPRDSLSTTASVDDDSIVSREATDTDEEVASEDPKDSEFEDSDEYQPTISFGVESQAKNSPAAEATRRLDQIQAFHQAYTKTVGPSITISDDLSVADKVEERHLLALRVLIPEEQKLPPQGGNHALQDYQMQLMLLEQQNKKRLMMARQEQDMADHEQITAQEMSANGPVHLGKRPRDSTDDAYASKQSMIGDLDDLSFEELQSHIERLQARARSMNGQTASKHFFRHKLLYRILRWVTVPTKDGSASKKRVLSSAYFDPPEWWSAEKGLGTYRCSIPVDNLELYLEKNKDIAFLVYKTYVEPSFEELEEAKRKRDSKSWTPVVTESIRPISEELIEAISTMLEGREEYTDILETFRSSHEVTAPYTFCYHHRSDLDDIAASCDDSTQQQLQLFIGHVVDTLGEVYNVAGAMISQGKVSHRYLEYLFKPGDTLVMRDNDGQYTGWIATSWPKPIWKERVQREKAEAQVKGSRATFLDPTVNTKKLRNDHVIVHTWSIQAWQWWFEGTFFRHDDALRFYIVEEIEHDEDEEAKKHEHDTIAPITDLKVMPARFCPSEIIDTLRRRGQTFWKCRERRVVSYRENEDDLLAADERYIVDLNTYRSLHKDNISYMPSMNKPSQRDDLGEDAMKQDQCPQEQFELLLPLKIKGFNLRRKKWYDLTVDRISDVIWKKEAFTKVVMDPKAKEIVRALITKQLASERSTDLIEGKGNGLILLLHGGPGTGKTLTAESVAEIAEKPLYRVTCGDVGTKAEAVEKYLESVFHLGKLWGCVVLLDEADVFLEQRDLQDLDRNALVSVFLRVLEYYEGILVLTSNRVGTFDEAFRSRIQLALHYPTLNQFQRLRIWENFIDRLESFNDSTVNISDLRYHLEDLSKEEMNGREIRNAITTARQYAEYMGTTLTYVHLQDVIEISRRFDQYLGDLRGGFTQDQLKKDEGVR